MGEEYASVVFTAPLGAHSSPTYGGEFTAPRGFELRQSQKPAYREFGPQISINPPPLSHDRALRPIFLPQRPPILSSASSVYGRSRKLTEAQGSSRKPTEVAKWINRHSKFALSQIPLADLNKATPHLQRSGISAHMCASHGAPLPSTVSHVYGTYRKLTGAH